MTETKHGEIMHERLPSDYCRHGYFQGKECPQCQTIKRCQFEAVLSALVHQIRIGTFFDYLGHDAKMLKAYQNAERLLHGSSIDGSGDANG